MADLSSQTSHSNQPTTARELRKRLTGAWKLESYMYLSVPPSSNTPFHPMTKNVQGMILYTADGYMSAQMQIPGQTRFDIGEASEAEWAECARRYFGYSGPYYISEEENGKVVLKHEFRVSYRPDLAGDIQVRGWRFEDDGQLLILGGEEPTMIKVSCLLISSSLLLVINQMLKELPFL
jgi:hypothetical protein